MLFGPMTGPKGIALTIAVMIGMLLVQLIQVLTAGDTIRNATEICMSYCDGKTENTDLQNWWIITGRDIPQIHLLLR